MIASMVTFFSPEDKNSHRRFLGSGGGCKGYFRALATRSRVAV